jgi:prefoldin beta subunit
MSGVDIRALEEAGKDLEEARGKLQELGEKQTQVYFQQKECEIVLEGFDFLDEGDVVMKQIGPALVRQELSEAKRNVQGRLEFITNQLKSMEASIEQAQKAVVACEQKFQQFQGAGGR